MNASGRGILRNSNLLRLLAGQVTSQLGDCIYRIAVLWWVKERSGSNAQVAMIALCSTVPGVLLMPFAGLAADGFDRRRLMIAMDLVRTVLLVGLALLAVGDGLRTWHLCFAALAISACTAFFTPTHSASISQVAPPEDLPAANSILNGGMALAGIVGPAIGGALIALGPAIAIALDAISFAASAAFLSIVRIPSARNPVGSARSVASELVDGLRLVLGQRVIRSALVVVGLMTFFAAPLPALLPGLAKDVLRSTGRGFGLLEGSIAAGFVAGVALAPRILQRVKTLGQFLLHAVIGSGLLLASVGTVRTLPIAMALLGAQAAMFALIHVSSTLFMQTLLPENVQGRGFGIVYTIVDGVVFLSLSASASIMGFVGVPAMFLICGAGVASSGFVGLFMPRLVSLRRPDAAAARSLEPTL